MRQRPGIAKGKRAGLTPPPYAWTAPSLAPPRPPSLQEELEEEMQETQYSTVAYLRLGEAVGQQAQDGYRFTLDVRSRCPCFYLDLWHPLHPARCLLRSLCLHIYRPTCGGRGRKSVPRT